MSLDTAIARRHVYYLAAFDNRGPLHYYTLYNTHSAKQMEGADYHIAVSAPEHIDDIHVCKWDIDYKQHQQSCHSTYHYLIWDDIAVKYMPKPGLRFYAESLAGVFNLVHSGLAVKTLKHAKTFAKTLVACYATAIMLPIILIIFALLALTHTIPVFLAMLIVIAILYAGHWLNKTIKVMWLVKGFNFNIYYAGRPNLLSERLTGFAKLINQSLQNPSIDEVLVVGHCYGSVLLPVVLSHLKTLQANQAQDLFKANSLKKKPILSVMSLALTSPLLAWLPKADWYRKAMEESSNLDLTWVDFSSPADGVCYPLLAFYPSVGISPSFSYTALSPRFVKLFDPEQYQRIVQKNKFRIHFQYLLSSTYTTHYDYFSLTAGTRSLRQRYVHKSTH